MTLLLLCLFPLVKTHVGIAREELKQIQALQHEQEARAVFCTLKTKLHEHAFSWEQLMQGVHTDLYTVKKLEQSTKHTSESGMILGVTLHLGKDTFERTVYVEKALDHTR